MSATHFSIKSDLLVSSRHHRFCMCMGNVILFCIPASAAIRNVQRRTAYVQRPMAAQAGAKGAGGKCPYPLEKQKRHDSKKIAIKLPLKRIFQLAHWQLAPGKITRAGRPYGYNIIRPIEKIYDRKLSCQLTYE
jgi:hypothetical protein